MRARCTVSFDASSYLCSPCVIPTLSTADQQILRTENINQFSFALVALQIYLRSLLRSRRMGDNYPLGPKYNSYRHL